MVMLKAPGLLVAFDAGNTWVLARHIEQMRCVAQGERVGSHRLDCEGTKQSTRTSTQIHPITCHTPADMEAPTARSLVSSAFFNSTTTCSK